MDEVDPKEQAEADKFLRLCMTHISNASDVQKKLLTRALLARPADSSETMQNAYEVWNGLTEAETMKLLSKVQEQFDQETWEFMSRWRG